jgi:hypothetical protein
MGSHAMVLYWRITRVKVGFDIAMSLEHAASMNPAPRVSVARYGGRG